MRACQIQEFGGPEVLQVVDVPKPEPGDGEVLIEVSRAGMNFADTHQRENSYLARYEVPLVLGGEVVGHHARRAAGGRADGHRWLRRVRRGPRVHRLPDPRRDGRGRGARPADPWPHGMAPVQDEREARPGRVGGRDLRRRRSRQPGGAAREAVRRRPRDRHGEHRGQACQGDRAGRGCRGRCRRGGPQGRADRGERGQAGGRGARDVGRPRVRPVRRRARARSGGSWRTASRAASRTPSRPAG